MQDMDILYKKSCTAFGIIVAVLVVFAMFSKNHLSHGSYLTSKEHAFSKDQLCMNATNRRLLASPTDYDIGVGNGGGEDGDAGNDDDGGGGAAVVGGAGGYGDDNRYQPFYCSKDDIYIEQGQTPPLPSGIPTYTVIVQNVGLSGSSISDIHLSCGWFASARTINPSLFKRLSYDDCLVNNGNPIYPGQTVSFAYANTYLYPMSVSSVTCD